jgi:hypothetical protein
MRAHHDKKMGGSLAGTATKEGNLRPKLHKQISEKKQRSSVETLSEFQKSRSCRIRIGLSSWRGKNNIEIRECSSLIPGIYFPSAQGVTLDISKLPELLKAIIAVEREAIERGWLL